MKILIKLGFALLTISWLAGCETTGLSPGERAGVNYPNYILSLEPRQAHSPAKLVPPIRLAVAQVGENSPSKKMLDKLENQAGLIVSVVGLPLPGDSETGYYNRNQPAPVDYATQVKSLCSLAQSAGADYVFLFGGNVDSWQKDNFLTVFNITIVGGFILPTTKIEMEGKAAGTLIDTATVEPVVFVSTDTEASKMVPNYLIQGKVEDMRAQLRDELVSKLTDELIKKISNANQSVTSQSTKQSGPVTN